MAEKIRWGILGGGKIAAKFADALKSVKDAELLAIGSRTTENAAAFGIAHKIPRRYGSYEQLAKDSNIDVIYIATPHHIHADNACLCLNAGRHVLCEKPLAATAAQAKRMIEAARSNKRFLMEAMWTRFLPLMDKARRLIAQNAIGTVQMLSADFGFRCARPVPARLTDPNLAGGALLDVGIYPLSLSSMLFGLPQSIQTTASFGPTGVDEQNASILSFGSGRMAMIYSAYTTQSQQEANIVGTDGIIKLQCPWYRGNKLSLIRCGKPEELIEVTSHENGFVYEILAVHEDIKNGRLENSLMPLDESLQIMQTMDTIRRQWGFTYPFE